jgi:hypothetical protein
MWIILVCVISFTSKYAHVLHESEKIIELLCTYGAKMVDNLFLFVKF